MGQFRLKIESDKENKSKIEVYSNFTEMTLVRIIIFLYIYQ